MYSHTYPPFSITTEHYSCKWSAWLCVCVSGASGVAIGVRRALSDNWYCHIPSSLFVHYTTQATMKIGSYNRQTYSLMRVCCGLVSLHVCLCRSFFWPTSVALGPGAARRLGTFLHTILQSITHGLLDHLLARFNMLYLHNQTYLPGDSVGLVCPNRPADVEVRLHSLPSPSQHSYHTSNSMTYSDRLWRRC